MENAENTWNHPLRWRHNGHDGVLNHQPHHCLLNLLFRRRWKKTSKLHVTGLWAGNSPVTGEFPTQMGSNAKMCPFDDVIMSTTGNDDVTTWKRFPNYWSFVIHRSPVWPVMRSFDVFFAVSLNKLFGKHMRWWWFDMPCSSRDVTEMCPLLRPIYVNCTRNTCVQWTPLSTHISDISWTLHTSTHLALVKVSKRHQIFKMQ